VALEVHPVTADRWPALAEFFGPSGAYSGCWCTWWRLPAAQFTAGCRDGAVGNRETLRGLVAAGRVPGLLGYEGGPGAAPPVGWVSVAPRPEFGRILRSPQLRPAPADPVAGDPADASVWAVVCFWIPRRNRGRGIGTELLAAAVAYARSSGARVVEGYPADTAGARRSPAELYTGTVGMFAGAGFAEVAPRGRRHIVRREI
jgi:GNAT superfamily N-acetyltransferase